MKFEVKAENNTCKVCTGLNSTTRYMQNFIILARVSIAEQAGVSFTWSQTLVK